MKYLWFLKVDFFKEDEIKWLDREIGKENRNITIHKLCIFLIFQDNTKR